MTKKHLKRNVKDSIFVRLFSIDKYKMELYKVFHPDDKDVQMSDIQTITLDTIMVNCRYNDLGLKIRNRIIFLLEAQSTWSINILVKDLLYLAETYSRYFVENKINIHSIGKIELPIPELYVLYTGKKKITQTELSLNVEFFGGKAPIDLKTKVITNVKKHNILSEYIKFAKLVDKYREQGKTDIKSVKELVDECIKKNILKEFLTEHKKEVIEMTDILFDQDYVTSVWEYESYNAGVAEGEAKGEAKGKLAAFAKMVKKKIITAVEAAKELGMSEKDFKKLAKI